MHLKLLSAAMFGVALSQSSLGWQMPFNAPHRLLRLYLQPNSDYSAGHRGIDLEAAIGETVYAPADGQVNYVGKIVNRGVLSLNHVGNLVSELEPVCSTLKAGALVSRGQAIGQICLPDVSYKSHVPGLTSIHFSLRVSGRYLSPQKFVGGLNPSRLLPYALG
jgi:murein DD-endopeptidase MepM/ murein hydrolase activator NlpD